MSKQQAILLVDDDKAFRVLTSGLLEEQGYRVVAAANAAAGLALIKEQPFDLVLTDLVMQGTNGIQLLEQIKAFDPKMTIIMITGFASIPSAVEAMKIGAFDYLSKPCSNDELLLKIKKALANKRNLEELDRLRTELSERYQFSQIIGKSPAMQSVFSIIDMVAGSDASILLSGETGSGKELVARAIHYNSPRQSHPFIAINCAALPETLLESELFGHEKGAFSGAIRQKPGRFELANSGTLFLDEIGDIPLSTQVKLLRVLQEKTFERIGGTQSISSDMRLISATNKNLDQEIQAGRFRNDLYFRLNVMPIHLPALRERKEDIPLLAQHFMKISATKNSKSVDSISEAAMKMLVEYNWPGNVRELENVIERAVLFCRNATIDVSHLSFHEQRPEMQLLTNARSSRMTEKEMTQLYARTILNEHNGNKKLACKTLGINFKTLQKRLGEL